MEKGIFINNFGGLCVLIIDIAPSSKVQTIKKVSIKVNLFRKLSAKKVVIDKLLQQAYAASVAGLYALPASWVRRYS